MYLTADDFGLHHKANTEIMRLARVGGIDYISLLVNMPFTAEAVRYYQKCKPCPIGLHVNLVEGRPLSDPKIIPGLVDRNGKFLPLPIFLLKLVFHLIDEQEIEIEIEKQINFMKKQKLKISHFNSHQNLHIFPPVNGILFFLVTKYKIPRVRSLSTIKTRLKKFPYKYLVFLTLNTLLNLVYPKTRFAETEFKEMILHPGTNYD